MIKKLFLLIPIFYFVVLPLVFWPTFYDQYELPKVIAFISVTSILTGCVITIISPRINNVKFNILSVLLLSLFSCLTVSGLVNFRQEAFLGQYYRYQGLAILFTLLAFAWLSVQMLGSIDPKLVGKIIGLGGITNAVLIIFQMLAFHFFHLPIYNYNGRIAGFFGNPNFAAGFLVLSFVFSYFYPPVKSFWAKIGIGSLFTLAILATDSRSAILAFLVVIGLICWKNKKAVVLISLVTLIAGLFLTSRRTSLIENRPAIWQKAIEAGFKKPVLGWGPENFDLAFRSTLKSTDFDFKNIRVDKAHNEFLEMFVAGGIVGLGLYLILIVTAIKQLWQRRSEKWIGANLIALTAYLVLGFLNVLNITEYLFFYLILATASLKTTDQG